jgi:hypothetical protein
MLRIHYQNTGAFKASQAESFFHCADNNDATVFSLCFVNARYQIQI